MRLISVLFILTFFCNLFSVAQSDTLRIKRGLRRYELDEVRVISPSYSEKIAVIEVIHLDDLKQKESINLTDLLKNVSGLNITTGSKGESNLRIRGFQKQNVKILVDGRPLSGGYFGNVNLSEIPVFDVSEVHIAKGAVPSFYGTNVSGGMVNFVSKKPSSENWLTLRTSVKRNNTHSMQLISAHSFEQWDYWVNLSGYKTDGFVLSEKFTPTLYQQDRVRQQSQNKSYDIQSKINFSLLDIHSLGVSMGYTFADRRNVPSSIYEARFRRFIDWRRYQVTALSSFQLGPWFTIKPSFYYDAYDNTYQEFSDINLTNMTLDSVLESWTFGSRINSRFIVNDMLSLHHFYKYEKEVYNRKDNKAYQEWTSNNTELYNSAFMINTNFNHNWKTSVSGTFSTSFRNFQNLIDSHLQQGYIEESIKTDIYFDPAFSINYNNDDFNKHSYCFIPDQFGIGFGFSKNTHYPTMHNLFSGTRGNPYLKPEVAVKNELNTSYAYFFTNLLIKVETSLFYNILRDKIDRLNSEIYLNQMKLKNAGFEIRLANRFFSLLETEHSFSYLDTEMNKDYVFYEIPKISQYNTLSYNIMKNLKASYSINFDGDRKSPDDSGSLHNLRSYTIHNASVVYSLNQYKIAFSLQNLFDKNYQEEYGYPAAGRNFSLSFEWVIF